MTDYRLLIVDDEPLARLRLERLLQEHPEFLVIEEFSNGPAVLDWLADNSADVILLDIQMPELTGLEVAQKIQELPSPPAIVFCTAYDEYAIDAFKVDAVDYLLKPVRKEELAKTLNRVKEKLDTVVSKPHSDHKRTHISARTHKGLELIPLENVIACIAEDKYIKIIHTGGELLIDETLKQLEEEFPEQLLRVHRSTLVNRFWIERIETQAAGGHQLRMKNYSQPIPISRRQLPEIRQQLKML